MTEPIWFYAPHEDYGWMSNFSNHGFTCGGKYWKTSEHFFQAMKFKGTKYEGEVRKANSPGDAAKMGRRRDLPLRRNWENVKEEVMMFALRQKTKAHPWMVEALIKTGDAVLVEHSARDKYWGDGGNGSGKNRLGRCWMNIRKECQNNV